MTTMTSERVADKLLQDRAADVAQTAQHPDAQDALFQRGYMGALIDLGCSFEAILRVEKMLKAGTEGE